jgi:hypothetical protein
MDKLRGHHTRSLTLRSERAMVATMATLARLGLSLLALG